MDFYIFGKKYMSQSFSIQINIPVKDHLYKYLRVKYGSELFLANRRTAIGSVILSMLSNNSNEDVRHEGIIAKGKTFNTIIKEEHYLRNGMFIDNRTARLFNEMVDSMFKEELYCHIIINNYRHDSQYLDCIRNFLSVYHITEDDLKLESVYRDFKRKRDAIRERMQLKITA